MSMRLKSSIQYQGWEWMNLQDHLLVFKWNQDEREQETSLRYISNWVKDETDMWWQTNIKEFRCDKIERERERETYTHGKDLKKEYKTEDPPVKYNENQWEDQEGIEWMKRMAKGFLSSCCIFLSTGNPSTPSLQTVSQSISQEDSRKACFSVSRVWFNPVFHLDFGCQSVLFSPLSFPSLSWFLIWLPLSFFFCYISLETFPVSCSFYFYLSQ